MWLSTKQIRFPREPVILHDVIELLRESVEENESLIYTDCGFSRLIPAHQISSRSEHIIYARRAKTLYFLVTFELVGKKR